MTTLWQPYVCIGAICNTSSVRPIVLQQRMCEMVRITTLLSSYSLPRYQFPCNPVHVTQLWAVEQKIPIFFVLKFFISFLSPSLPLFSSSLVPALTVNFPVEIQILQKLLISYWQQFGEAFGPNELNQSYILFASTSIFFFQIMFSPRLCFKALRSFVIAWRVYHWKIVRLLAIVGVYTRLMHLVISLHGVL